MILRNSHPLTSSVWSAAVAGLQCYRFGYSLIVVLSTREKGSPTYISVERVAVDNELVFGQGGVKNKLCLPLHGWWVDHPHQHGQ